MGKKFDNNECSKRLLCKKLTMKTKYLGFWDKTETKSEIKKKPKTKYLTADQWVMSNKKVETKKSDIGKFIKTQQDKKIL